MNAYLSAMKLTAACFCLLFPTLVWTQKIIPLTLDLSFAEAQSKTTLPFAAIRVVDARFDRINIGCVNKVRRANSSSIKYAPVVAVFPDSLCRYLPEVFQRFVTLDATANDTLVLLIKQFRVSEQFFNPINLQFEPTLLLRLSLSAFQAKEGQLSKLFSVDDLLSQKLPRNQIPKNDVVTDDRNDALLQLLQRIVEKRSWQSNAPDYTMSAVQQGLQQRFSLPLFTDAVLRPGVYKNFHEFKQNSPSVTNISISMRKDRVVSLKDAEGNSLTPSDYWGLCDGNKFFIVFRNEFYELLPSDRSFYFPSYIRNSDLYGMPGFGDYAPQMGVLAAALQKSVDNQKFTRYFFLNMDEENIYLEDVFGKSSLKKLQNELLK
ncbi:MAG: hypothetical protein EOO14_11145 [Chitinophagaceae bacterium]|nr:MAG: hypothetical protein EOO14_11145 [Chitinophagaceae bacterium]